MSWALGGSLAAFTLYLTLTGAVSGAADQAAVRAAKAVLSGTVPVVGGILSDAAETLLAGAGVLRGGIGIFGTLGVLAICAYPFLHLGIQYLLYRGAGFLAEAAGGGPLPPHPVEHTGEHPLGAGEQQIEVVPPVVEKAEPPHHVCSVHIPRLDQLLVRHGSGIFVSPGVGHLVQVRNRLLHHGAEQVLFPFVPFIQRSGGDAGPLADGFERCRFKAVCQEF